MKILYIHSLMFHHNTWQRAARKITECGIELSFLPQTEVGILENGNAPEIDLLITDLSPGLPRYRDVLAFAITVPHRMGLSVEAPEDLNTFPTETLTDFKQYIMAVSLENYLNWICFLANQTGLAISFRPPQIARTTGVYHPDAPEHFQTSEMYEQWWTQHHTPEPKAWIAILFYYTQLVEENTIDIDSLIRAIEDHAMAPLCIFSAGVEELGGKGEPEWIKLIQKAPDVDLILNLMAGRLFKTAEKATRLKAIDVPVIQLLRAHGQTPEQWTESPQGLPAISAVYGLHQPETSGVIAPILVAGTRQDTDQRPQGTGYRPFLPVKERIQILCRRIRRWVYLRQCANRDKRITIVLHNNPCKGLEATVGLAAGLDTFESLVRLLQELKTTGYHVGQVPMSGKAIFDDIMERKAISEFRWTTADEIVRKGGALALMDKEEYQPWFDRLPKTARDKVFEDWGTFPGQGMVYSDNGVEVLVITGIQYGNIRIMVQPKRGCYGAKCTGEVCRILHDPDLAPPHHWLATYKYIQEKSDAVVHFGTEGALEYLSGKQLGLSDACFPEISIGDLPNLYVYVMDAVGEGMTAKRRGQAVLVDHMTPVYRQAPMDEQTTLLADLIEQYLRAVQMKELTRGQHLAEQLIPLLQKLHQVDAPPMEDDLPRVADLVRRRIALAGQALIPEGLHLLGAGPDPEATGRLLAGLLRTPPPGLPDLKTLSDEQPENNASDSGAFDAAAAILADMTMGQSGPKTENTTALRRFCRTINERLIQCDKEITHLLAGLSGGFIPPGLGGSLSRGYERLLPTGSNFFAFDVMSLPTKSAWDIGRQMADRLLIKYLEDEGRFPESIGVNIWSTDAFKSDGELLCQILHLMGARPLWHPSGRVTDVEAVPLDHLFIEHPEGMFRSRPRVDVTVQTSSIMRDMVPNFCEWLDQAVIMLNNRDEPEEWNIIRKHCREHMKRLREQTYEELSDTQLQRMATLRVFSSGPGTYSSGVGLALDASAWQTTADLAAIHINSNGYAYGYDDAQMSEFSTAAHQMLADQLTGIDIAYMKQASAEYNLLDCSCYAISPGGMAAAATALSADGGTGTRKGAPKIYWGDSTLPADADVRDLTEEVRRTAMANLLNPAWIDHAKAHGYQGAQAVGSSVNTLFKWSATTDQVDKSVFDAMVHRYIIDEENRQWLRQTNAYALEEITRRLLEAESRGLWSADKNLQAAVQAAALQIEGDMEETIGEVEDTFQGGRVDVLTAVDVENWQMDWRMGDY